MKKLEAIERRLMGEMMFLVGVIRVLEERWEEKEDKDRRRRGCGGGCRGG